MYAELSFYIHLRASMGSTTPAGWSRQREDVVAQFDSLCSAASTVSSLSMLLCNGRDSSRAVSSAATPAGASFSWECAQYDDSKFNGLQSRAGQERSHPYSKEVLAARASSPPAVQGSRVVAREDRTKTVYSVCFAHLFLPAGHKES